jgi:hypothetical protein
MQLISGFANEYGILITVILILNIISVAGFVIIKVVEIIEDGCLCSDCLNLVDDSRCCAILLVFGFMYLGMGVIVAIILACIKLTESYKRIRLKTSRC